MKSREKALVVTKEPLAGCKLNNLIRLIVQNRFRINFRYVPRMLYSLIWSTITAESCIMERMRFDKDIEKTEIKNHPIFIIGHWRTGTTYVHNLLSLDKNLAYFTTLQAYIPGVFLGSKKIFKPIIVYSLPEKRPMDDVIMDADLPQEEEYAIGAFSPYSYYNGWCFPNNMEFYNRFVCMEDVPAKTIKEWEKVYLYLLKKVTLCNFGKRLVLKNPANTARIKLLLEIFPNAKFILTYRNPYDLYFSMIKFMKTVIPLYCLQEPQKFDKIEKSMMRLYTLIFKKYFIERKYIPEGNIVEVKYEDFIKKTSEELKRIYDELDIDGFKESEKAFKEYIISQATFKRDRYELNDDIKEKIYKEWNFTFKEFGYDR